LSRRSGCSPSGPSPPRNWRMRCRAQHRQLWLARGWPPRRWTYGGSTAAPTGRTRRTPSATWDRAGVCEGVPDRDSRRPVSQPGILKMAGRLELRLSSHLDSVVSAIMLRARESDRRRVEALDAGLGTLDAHSNREQMAQVAISCRRFLERLADVVYPPKPEPVGGRKVGKAEYKNRLWAFAKEQLGPGDMEAAEQIGMRLMRSLWPQTRACMAIRASKRSDSSWSTSHS
jgi:hypothetical protein